jgi:UPF0042 nucleotide-binding protein
MDVRSATSLPLVPQQLDALRTRGHVVKPLFLDANTDTLVRRYSETRRRHPLSQGGVRRSGETEAQLDRDERRALVEAIELERNLLTALRAQAHVIDSSMIRAAQLQGYVKALVSTRAAQLTLVFESFAFKRGVPTDADFVFDVRMLPNPHYEPALKALTGCDQPVVDFLHAQPDVQRMRQQLCTFVESWLPDLARDNRSYVTVAIGCTGGQHRSVYLVEQLEKHFAAKWATLKRHREMDAKP